MYKRAHRTPRHWPRDRAARASRPRSCAPILPRLWTGAAATCALVIGCGDSAGPEAPPAPLQFEALSTGALHTCALTVEGRPYCWGHGAQGQLGIGELGTEPGRFQPTPVAGDLRFTQIAAGKNRTCALDDAGVAYCWGTLSGYRAPQTGSVVIRQTPSAFLGVPALAAVSVGGWHACGLTSDGTAYCWGDNDWGQLGTATGTSSLEPVQVAGDLRFTAIAAGDTHTCALTAEGAAYCWGDNGRHQLGVPWTDVNQGPDTCVVALARVQVACSLAPVPVVGALAFRGIGAASCGLTGDGTLYCWGNDRAMSLDPPVAPSGPARVTGAPTLDRLAGGVGVCGLTAAGDALCFPASTVSLETPEAIVDLSVGAFHICARIDTGLAYCGGDNRNGQLGTGDSSSTAALVGVSGPISEAEAGRVGGSM